MKVDTEKLCDHCEMMDVLVRRDTCEGRYCAEAEEDYLEYCGIKSIQGESLCFANLKLKQSLFAIRANDIIPSVTREQVLFLSQTEEHITAEGGNFKIFIKTASCKGNRHSDKTNGTEWFLNKGDALAELERICTERIVQLARSIPNKRGGHDVK
jgi:hypothetical protein